MSAEEEKKSSEVIPVEESTSTPLLPDCDDFIQSDDKEEVTFSPIPLIPPAKKQKLPSELNTHLVRFYFATDYRQDVIALLKRCDQWEMELHQLAKSQAPTSRHVVRYIRLIECVRKRLRVVKDDYDLSTREFDVVLQAFIARFNRIFVDHIITLHCGAQVLEQLFYGVRAEGTFCDDLWLDHIVVALFASIWDWLWRRLRSEEEM